MENFLTKGRGRQLRCNLNYRCLIPFVLKSFLIFSPVFRNPPRLLLLLRAATLPASHPDIKTVEGNIEIVKLQITFNELMTEPDLSHNPDWQQQMFYSLLEFSG